jgi:hypothetical protein
MSSIPGRKTLRCILVRKEGGEKLPATLLKEINNKVGLKFDTTEIDAMHRIPGKHFLRMDSKIAVLPKKEKI